jgi:DNA repair photolyase
MKITETEAKSLIQKSKIPSIDYVANPYTGCVLGCAYCYASFMGRAVGETVADWGEYLYVKKNAVELARKELAKMSADQRRGTLLLSSVTDPYQGPERKYLLSRGILQAAADVRYPGTIRILTKSPLVVRDIDVLRRFERVDIGMTLTTTDDSVSRWLEVRAPRASHRIKALAALHEAGINTFAFVGPLLPHFAERPELLDHLFRKLSETGVREVYMEHINLKRYIRERMNVVLEGEPAELREAYANARSVEHRKALDAIVPELLAKHGLKLRFDEVIYHDEFQAKYGKSAAPVRSRATATPAR